MKEVDKNTKWLREREVAAITGISVSTLQKMRHFRYGPRYTKIGRSVRYAEEDVHSYMAARRIELDDATRLHPKSGGGSLGSAAFR